MRALDNALLHIGIAAGKTQKVHPILEPLVMHFDRAFTIAENEIAAITTPPDGVDLEQLDIVFDRQDRAQAHLDSARAAAAEFLHHLSAALG